MFTTWLLGFALGCGAVVEDPTWDALQSSLPVEAVPSSAEANWVIDDAQTAAALAEHVLAGGSVPTVGCGHWFNRPVDPGAVHKAAVALTAHGHDEAARRVRDALVSGVPIELQLADLLSPVDGAQLSAALVRSIACVDDVYRRQIDAATGLAKRQPIEDQATFRRLASPLLRDIAAAGDDLAALREATARHRPDAGTPPLSPASAFVFFAQITDEIVSKRQ